MKVEIWSDIACPWCYIGRRRFEKALGQFEHKDQVEVVWRSFQLDPDAPREYDGSLNDMLAEKKGISRQQAEALHQQLTALAAQEGLEYHFERARVGNSFDAHRQMKQAAYHELAVEVGLDADETRRMLETHAYAADVRLDVQRARALGINGVPFFLFDEKYAISGAQPVELFLTALDRTWKDSPKIVEVVSADQDSRICDDESCPV